MNHSISRRNFCQRAALVAVAFPFISARNVLGANERLNIAAIGAGGKGAADIAGVESENLVALCDVDDKNAAGTFAKYSAAKRYRDYRKLFEQEGTRIDAVTISTPDHMHAPIALQAMKMGKHIYCQKPLTRTVAEARQLAEVARQRRVTTQMGNQGHSHSDTRRLVELIQAGVLGDVTEVHCWTDRPIWPQGISRPTDTPPVPPTLDWDLWLGVAPLRPYHPAYVPFKWRGFWDFGTGALGDMACHVMDLPFFALNLRDPVEVKAESEGGNDETAPVWSIIHYRFPARDGRPAVTLIWYDGGKKPPASLVKKDKLPENGVIMVGRKDTLFVPSYWGAGTLVSGAAIADYQKVAQTLPRLMEFDRGHYQEWIEACKGRGRALSNFDYAGPMTEALLLGNVALRAGTELKWDAKAFKITNSASANKFLRAPYRPGWA